MQDSARLGVAKPKLMLALAAPKESGLHHGQKLEPECFGDAAHRWQHDRWENPGQPGRVAACGRAACRVTEQTAALHQI